MTVDLLVDDRVVRSFTKVDSLKDKGNGTIEVLGKNKWGVTFAYDHVELDYGRVYLQVSP